MIRSQLLRVFLLSISFLYSSHEQNLVNTHGYPCSYDFEAVRGHTGCQSGGTCSPQVITGPPSIDVSWFEDWYCWQGFVHAHGRTSDINTQFYDSDGHSWTGLTGLLVTGIADVTVYYPDGWAMDSTYSGYDGADCDGSTTYSGPYWYAC